VRRALLAATALLLLAGGLAWLLHEPEPVTAQEQLARARRLAQALSVVSPERRPAALDELVAAYDKVETFPDAEGAHAAALGEAFDLLLLERRRDAALARVRKLLALTPAPEDAPARLMRVAEEREAAAEYEAARGLYVEVADLVTRTADLSAEAAFRAGVVLEDRMPEIARGDVIALWRRYVDVYPKGRRVPEVLLRLAALYRAIGERELAIAAYRKIVDEHGDSDAAAVALREMGLIYGEELGKHKEAAKAFEELEAKHGDRPAASGARAMREQAEREAQRDEQEEYRDGHYGGGLPDFSDLLAKTPREELAELIAMRLDIEHVDVDISIAPEERRMTAEAAIRIRHHGTDPRMDLGIMLAPGLTVTAARMDEEDAEASHEGTVLRVDFERPWPAEETRLLRLSFRTGDGPVMGPLRLGEDGAGFGIGSAGAVPTGVVGDMYTVRAAFRLPVGWSVVASGRPIDGALLEEGFPRAPAATTRTGDEAPAETRAAFTTDELPIFSLYFAYGRFHERRATWRGRPIAVRWLNAEFERADELLTVLSSNLDFYAERFGEPPWPCFTIVEASVHELGAAGIGPATMLLLFPEAFQKEGKLPLNLLAHELAHQWWGNAVPVTLAEGWSPWLSEGLASYSDALSLERREGEEAARRHLTKYAHLYYEQMLVLKDRSLADSWSSSPSYRSVAYEKGARVLHMLRRALGDEAFFDGLRRYAREFRFQDSTNDDLRASLEGASGLDLKPFFDDWVLRDGFPEIAVAGVTATALEGGGCRVEVSIAQEGPLYRVPRAEVRFEAPGRAPETRPLAITCSPALLEATLPFVPARVVFDPDDDVLKLPGLGTEWTPALAAGRARRRGGGGIGRPAPRAVFTSEAGTPWDLDARRGEAVIICVYAVGSRPSTKALEEMEAARAALEAEGRGAVLLAVARDPIEEQVKARKRTGGAVPLARADDDALTLFGGFRSVPAYVVIDRAGVVRGRTVGVRLKDDLLADVERASK